MFIAVCVVVVVAGFIVSSYLVLETVGSGGIEQLKETCTRLAERLHPPELSPEQENCLLQCGTMNMMAYEAYSRGNVSGTPEKEILCYSEALAYDPLYTWAYRARAYSYQKQHELVPAIADYTKAIEIDPHFTRAYHGLALTLWEKQDYSGIRNLIRFAHTNDVMDAIPPRLLELVRRVPVSWIDGGQMAHA